jgi:hypothetical protein
VTIRILISALLLSGAACAGSAAPDAHGAQNSLDWSGVYKGTVPCASCSGIETWLRLTDATETKTVFEMNENYRGGKKDESFHTEGEATWGADGAILTMGTGPDAKRFFIGEGFAEMVGDDMTSDNPEYRLAKQEVFADVDGELIVDPASVKYDGKDRLTFSGLMNFSNKMEGGHTSLTADFVLACKAQTYTMPKLAYYTDKFAGGEKLHEETANSNPPLPVGSAGEAMAQAAAAYCH